MQLQKPGGKPPLSGQEAVDASNAATLAFLQHHLQWTPAGQKGLGHLPNRHRAAGAESAQGQEGRAQVQSARNGVALAEPGAAAAAAEGTAAAAVVGTAAAAAAAAAGTASAPLDQEDLQVDIPCTSSSTKAGTGTPGSLPSWWRGPPARQVPLREGDEAAYQQLLGEKVMGLLVMAGKV
jgi:hypothetical protein